MKSTTDLLVLGRETLIDVCGGFAAQPTAPAPKVMPKPAGPDAATLKQWTAKFEAGWKPCDIAPARPAYERWFEQKGP